jgi:hypothetical protein
MANVACEEHDRLNLEAHTHLKKLQELVNQQIDAFESGAHERFMAIDKEVENALGEKERRIGELRQHDEEHGCQSETFPKD